MARKLLVTPRGVAVYPRLAGKPDTKFEKDGVWKTGLVALNDAEGAALKQTIDEAHKQSVLAAKEEQAKVEQKKRKKIAVDVTPYTVDEDTGKITFNFKMRASGISKKTNEPWTMQPALFDAAGQPITNSPRIGGGSTIRVSYELNPYTRPSTEQKGTLLAGVSLRLYAVQIIELVEFGGNAASFGFEVEEATEVPADADDETDGEVGDEDEDEDEDGDEF